MAIAQKMTPALFSAWGFLPRKGLLRINIRKATPNGTYGPAKRFFLGSAGPLIKIWDGSAWRTI